MSRGKEVWAKVEPSFILGRSPAGQAFCSMSLAHQAVYLRLWCLCIETRTLRHRCVGAASALLSRNVGVSQRTLRSFLDVAPKQLVKVGEFVEVLGVYEHHKGLAFRDLPQTGNERGSNDPCLGENRVVELRVRVKPPLPPPTHPGTDPGTNPEPRQAGGRDGFEISEPPPWLKPQPPEAGPAGHGLVPEPLEPQPPNPAPGPVPEPVPAVALAQAVEVSASSSQAPAAPEAVYRAACDICGAPVEKDYPATMCSACWKPPKPLRRYEMPRIPVAACPTPEPLPIAKISDPQAGWENFLRAFPAVDRKAIERHAVRERADSIGRPFDLLLAQVVEVCVDEEAGKVKIQHSPLALASSRLRDGRGLKNGTLAKVREALGMRPPAAPARTPAPPPAPTPPPAPPPSVEDLKAALDRAERSNQTAVAAQIRRSLERLHQESACAR